MHFFFIKTLLFFIILAQNTFFLNISKAEKVDNKQTFLEADIIKSKENSFYAKGHVIMRRSDMLINADEIEGEKNKKTSSNNYKNIKSQTTTNNDNTHNSNKNTEKYIFNANNWVKLRTNTDDIIYSKKVFYNENTKNGWIDNAQIFPGGNKRDHTEIYSTKVYKNNGLYTLKNATLCPCKLFVDDGVESNRILPFNCMKDENELIEKPSNENKNAIDNNDEEMHRKLQFTPISAKSSEIIYNEETSEMTFKHLRLRAFGIPIFYLPYYKIHTDNSGDTGFLMPVFMMLGRREIGFELPFYWKIRQDMDLLISRAQYFELREPIYKYRVSQGDNRYSLKDLSRFRDNTTQFRFRHLISTSNNYESYYKIEAMMTDRTQLFNEKTGLGQINSDGSILKGYRWDIDIESKIRFSKTTFLNIEQNWSSDRNILYIYKNDFRQYQINKTHLYDINEKRYLSAEFYTFHSRLLELNNNITPNYYPVINSEYIFDKDKFGGHFYVKANGSYLNRDEGYTTARATLDYGYTLPYYTKKGTKITFDTLARLQYNNVKYSEYTERSYLPSINSNSQLYIFGNYGGLLERGYYGIYGTNGYSFNSLMFLNFNKLQAEHPLILYSIFGKTIFTPKVAIRYTPNNGRKLYLPIEDNINLQMNYYNAFDLLQSSGYGVYDTGGSAVYGFDFTHQFKKNIEVFGGIAQNVRLGDDINENILADMTGYRTSVSDIMMYFGAKLYNLSGSGYLNYDINRKDIRVLGTQMIYSHRYFNIMIGYNLFSKYANIYGQQLDIMTVSLTLNPTDKIKIVGNFGYNFRGIETYNGFKKPDFTNYRLSILWTISCLRIGITMSKNNFTLPNVKSDLRFLFTVTMVGIG